MIRLISGLSRQHKIEYSVLIIVAALLYLYPYSVLASENSVRIGFNICLYAVLAQMWNLMSGYTGLLSLGQQLFIGISGYTTAIVCTTYGLPFAAAFIASGVVSALMSLFISALLLRMRGMYFAVATWVLSEMVKILLTGWKLVNYGGGMNVRVQPYPGLQSQYVMMLTLMIASFLLVYLLLNSHIGLGLTAMRDDPEAAAGLGINIFAGKTLCFTICGFVTGLGGSLAYLNKLSVFPNGAFSIDWTIAIVVSVVIGGIGTTLGPILGAVIYVMLFNILSQYAGYSNIILGAIAIAVILLMPKGIIGMIHEKLGIEFFSARRNYEKRLRR